MSSNLFSTSTRTLGDVVAGMAIVSMAPDATVLEAAREMARRNKGSVLITERGRLEGIFTERDLLNRVVARGLDPAETKLGDVMTHSLVVARPDESCQSGIRKMMAVNCRHLPVVDGDRVVGIVSRRELMAREIQGLETDLDRAEAHTLFI